LIEFENLERERRKVMSKRLVFLSVIVLLITMVTTAWAQSPKAAPAMKTVKVGVISAHSGPIAFYGLSVLRTVELVVKDINERGTTGKGPGTSGISWRS
jgi:fumarate reductase subunit D